MVENKDNQDLVARTTRSRRTKLMNLSELVESLGATEFKARLVAELDSLVEQNPDFVYITQDQLA